MTEDRKSNAPAEVPGKAQTRGPSQAELNEIRDLFAQADALAEAAARGDGEAATDRLDKNTEPRPVLPSTPLDQSSSDPEQGDTL